MYQINPPPRSSDSKLFGWQGQVGNELRNIIQLVSPMSWQPLEDRKHKVGWAEVRRVIEQLEAGIKEEVKARSLFWRVSPLSSLDRWLFRRPHLRQAQPQPDPDGPLVRRWIVEQREAGMSWERIYSALIRRKARTREGREWSMGRIRRAYEEEVAKDEPQT